MEALIDALLMDDNGISEEAYDALCEYLKQLSFCPKGAEKSYPEAVHAKRMLEKVKRANATDGRFYLSS